MRGHEWGYVYSEHWLPMALPSDIFRRAAQPITTSFGGSASACWIAFIAHSAVKAVSRRIGTPAPPPESSIVRACKALKKGGTNRFARVRCWQADQRQEAT